MPYTEKQRRMFHAKAAEGDPTFVKLAKEADSMPDRPPVSDKAPAKKHSRHPGSSKKRQGS